MSLSAPSAAGAAGCADRNAEPGSVPMAKAEEAVLCLINKQRSKRELSTLARDAQLDEPARDYSKSIVSAVFCAHACKGEPKLGERLADYLGLSGGGYGDNIANGT